MYTKIGNVHFETWTSHPEANRSQAITGVSENNINEKCLRKIYTIILQLSTKDEMNKRFHHSFEKFS